MDINDRSVIEVPLGLLWPIVFLLYFRMMLQTQFC